jgi:hypothetical protein
VGISADFYFSSVACHEAGHAVTWWDHDIEVETLDVWRPGLLSDSRGLVMPGDIEENMRGWTVGIAAGALAQVKYLQEYGLSEQEAQRITEEGSWGDDQSLNQQCGFFGFSHSYIKSLAEASLNRRWSLVRAVGNRLEHSHHLPGSVAR